LNFISEQKTRASGYFHEVIVLENKAKLNPCENNYLFYYSPPSIQDARIMMNTMVQQDAEVSINTLIVLVY
jgi:hypothetical protein